MGHDGPDPAGGAPESGSAWGAFAYLLSGPALYGGLGWLLDRYAGSSFFFPAGLLFGVALGMYLVFKRYNRTS